MSIAGWTDKGLYRLLKHVADSVALPTTFRVALCTSAQTPSELTNTFANLTEIAPGNGYTAGGYTVDRVDDFDQIIEDDTNGRARIILKDIVWTAAGGPIPSSGSGARYAILTDDNVTQADREVYCWWDLGSARSVADGQPLTLVDLEMRVWAKEPA